MSQPAMQVAIVRPVAIAVAMMEEDAAPERYGIRWGAVFRPERLIVATIVGAPQEVGVSPMVAAHQ